MRGVYAATAEVPRTALPMTAAARRVAREVDADRLGVLEAAQATELVLRAIAGSDGTRASVLARLRASTERDGILGSFRFDPNGDMTPGSVPIVRFTGPDEGARSRSEARSSTACCTCLRASWTEPCGRWSSACWGRSR